MKKALPAAYTRFASTQRRTIRAYERLGAALLEAGPLERRTAELVKLGIAIGARLEGGVHAHVRRAREAGVSPDAIRHAARLALTTVGFPSMMAALTWVEDELGPAPPRARRARGSRTAPRRRRG